MTDTSDGAQDKSLQEMARAAFARDPALPVIEFEKRWFTWGDLHQVAQQLSATIVASGADARATVAFVPRNCPSALAALLGLIADGRTIKMIYAFQSAAGIARDLVRLKPSVLVAAPRDLSPEVLETARAEGIAVIALTDMLATALPGLSQTRRPHDEEAPAHPQIQILTSGTTGTPKQFPIRYALIAAYLQGGTTMYSSHGADFSQMPPVLLFFPVGNIATFPDAKVIWTHRDPYATFASSMSMRAHSRPIFNKDPDIAYMRDHFPLQLAFHLARPLELSRERPKDIYHLYYDDLVTNPLAQMKQIYAWLGDAWTAPAETGMQAWLAANPQGRFGKHSYSLAQWGFSKQDLAPYFSDYLRAHPVATGAEV